MYVTVHLASVVPTVKSILISVMEPVWMELYAKRDHHLPDISVSAFLGLLVATVKKMLTNVAVIHV